MVRYCLLCHKVTDKGHSFHGFPKDAEIRTLWLQACNLVETDDVSKVKLCSKHFFPSDFIDANAKIIGGRMTLKAKAFPRKFVPNIIAKTIIHHTSEVAISPLQSTSATEQDIRVISTESCDIRDIEPSNNVHDIPNLPKRRKFFEPRYVGEITAADISTPKRAKRCLELAKNTIRKKNQKIQNLQKQNRRLLKQIDSLKSLVTHLRKKD